MLSSPICFDIRAWRDTEMPNFSRSDIYGTAAQCFSYIEKKFKTFDEDFFEKDFYTPKRNVRRFVHFGMRRRTLPLLLSRNNTK